MTRERQKGMTIRTRLTLAVRRRLASDRGSLGTELHQVASNTRGVVAGDQALFQIIPENGYHAERLDGIEIVDDLTGAFAGVLLFQFIRGRSLVDQGEVENLFLRVAIQRADMIGGGQPEALVGL